MTLEEIGLDLWTLRYPLRVAGLQLGGRTTVARLGDGSLWVHSPGPMDAEAAAQLAELGPVRTLVAPANGHHLHLAAAADRFPEARTFGTRGLRKKGVRTDEELGAHAPARWSSDLAQVALEGVPFTDEVVFFHRASQTLIVTDLCFNIREAGDWFTRFGLGLNGALGRFGPSRLMKSAIKDRAALTRGIDAMLEWPIEQISVCHGELLRGGGRAALSDAFAWLRG